MVEIESTACGFAREQDRFGRFLCPVCATGLPPFLRQPITQVSGLRQEYLVEVFKCVTFVFTSSEHMKRFSHLVRAHFNLDPAQVPHLFAQANIFHTDSFRGGASLPRHRMSQIAHGQWEGAYPHVRAYVAQIMSLSTALRIEIHMCRPWRNFRYLKGVKEPLRLSSINVEVTVNEFDWRQTPETDGLRHFLHNMMMGSITGRELD